MMIIRSADFVKSSPTLKDCPADTMPEFGFIGRSNVGKSSLINMLTGFTGLAKISGQPGKTRTINHFLVNNEWYLADLPGYGYAKVPIKQRDKWVKATREYILKRENLVCLFMLIDTRIEPQRSDLEFMEFLGLNNIPFARIFTKADKISSEITSRSVRKVDDIMLKTWESMPSTFICSSVKGTGREEILSFIEESINNFSNQP
jgi:GTP-binding protein